MRLTAACVTFNSSAAPTKPPWRAAASKARKPFKEGRRRICQTDFSLAFGSVKAVCAGTVKSALKAHRIHGGRHDQRAFRRSACSFRAVHLVHFGGLRDGGRHDPDRFVAVIY